MKHGAMLLLMAWLLAGCASTPARLPHDALPYDAWYLGFSAPPYMEAWVETADVEDVRGQVFQRAGAGTASLGHAGDVEGWNGMPGGLGRHVTGADLPRRIHVRWQSLVEPQTYTVTLEIPAHARELMLTRVSSSVDPAYRNWRKAIAIGLAPGGMVKVWVTGPVGQPVEVLCQQAKMEPKGPYRGMSEGRHRPVSERTAAYLKTHPISYDAWKCPGTP